MKELMQMSLFDKCWFTANILNRAVAFYFIFVYWRRLKTMKLETSIIIKSKSMFIWRSPLLEKKKNKNKRFVEKVKFLHTFKAHHRIPRQIFLLEYKFQINQI